MATCSSDPKTYYDWVIAVTPIIISCVVAIIGILQYRTNKHKFRLDLYNRRFAVFEKSLEYFQGYYSKDQENITNCAKEFIRFYRESVFLFGLDSDVYKVLTELKDTLSFLVQFDERHKEESYDRDEFAAMSKAKSNKRDPHVIMQDLESALMLWLDFKKIEK